MSEIGKLPAGSYGGIEGRDLKPYVPSSAKTVEFSPIAVIVGLLTTFLFAMSNTYLGLKVGLTIAAGIPASILGVGILKLLKKNTVLQDNVIQALGGMGESVASGIIFTLATLLLWGMKITFMQTLVIVIVAAILGIFLSSMFRRFLVVEEHGKELVFPESIAIAEIIVNAAEGESEGFKALINGFGLGALFKLIGQGLGFIRESVSTKVWTTQVSLEYTPSLVGLGYIIGPRIASYLFAGGIIAWFGLIPLISLFGSYLPSAIVNPGTVPIPEMDPATIWKTYVRNIGVGCVTMSGFLSLGKNLPSIIRSFGNSIAGQLKARGVDSSTIERSERDTPFSWVIGLLVVALLIVWFFPLFKGGFIPAILVVFLAFFFGVVSGRMAGVVGSSNNPVSGMTIASLLIVTTVLKMLGHVGQEGMIQAILLGSILCVAISVAGGYAQAMKVSWILGGTTRKLDTAMFFATIVAGITGVAVLLLMDKAYGLASGKIAAPQANLMKVIVEGIMGGSLPWDLILIGAALAVAFFIMGLPTLIIAVGMYLSISTGFAIFIGGLVSSFVHRKYRNDEALFKRVEQKGIVFSSGVIAGDALSGVIVAIITIFVTTTISGAESLAGLMPWYAVFGEGSFGEIFSFVMFIALLYVFIHAMRVKKNRS